MAHLTLVCRFPVGGQSTCSKCLRLSPDCPQPSGPKAGPVLFCSPRHGTGQTLTMACRMAVRKPQVFLPNPETLWLPSPLPKLSLALKTGPRPLQITSQGSSTVFHSAREAESDSRTNQQTGCLVWASSLLSVHIPFSPQDPCLISLLGTPPRPVCLRPYSGGVLPSPLQPSSEASC